MESMLNVVTDYLSRQSWQIAVLIVLVGTGCWLLRKASAHWRYLLWCVVLAKCLIPPMTTLSLAVLPQQSSGVAGALGSMGTDLTAMEKPLVNGRPLPPIIEGEIAYLSAPSTNKASLPLSLKEWLGLVWIGGVCLIVGVILVKALRLQKYLKLDRREASVKLEAEMAALQKQLRLKKIPAIWEIEGFGQPFVWGLIRGAIYVPRDFGEAGTVEYRQGTLMHEMAHVERYDAGVNMLQILTQAMFFFHPLVWWLNRKIRQEREKCCDETAIARLNAAPREYGSAILENLIMEQQSRRAVPSLAIAGPIMNIEDRIKTIMKPDRSFFQKPTKMAIATALLLAGLVVPTALVLTVRAQDKTTETVLQAQDDSATSPDNEKAVPAEKVVGERPRGNCSISGKVISAATGKPVDHARMYLHYLHTYGSVFIRTASDGTFVFKDIPKGPFSLMSSRTAGYQDAFYDPEGKSGQFPLFSLEDGEHRSGIVVKIEPAYRISGKIRDENGKIPESIGTLNVLAW